MNKVFKIKSLGILIALAGIAAFSALAMVLWNALMPDIFGLPVVNYWQAMGILVLTRVFFGGIGRGRFLPWEEGHNRRGFHHGNPLRERWMSMTEEERLDFIKKEKSFHHFFHDLPSYFHKSHEENEQKNGKKGTDE